MVASSSMHLSSQRIGCAPARQHVCCQASFINSTAWVNVPEVYSSLMLCNGEIENTLLSSLLACTPHYVWPLVAAPKCGSIQVSCIARPTWHHTLSSQHGPMWEIGRVQYLPMPAWHHRGRLRCQHVSRPLHVHMDGNASDARLGPALLMRPGCGTGPH